MNTITHSSPLTVNKPNKINLSSIVATSIDGEWDWSGKTLVQWTDRDIKPQITSGRKDEMLTKQATIYHSDGDAYTVVLMDKSIFFPDRLDHDLIKTSCRHPIILIPVDNIEFETVPNILLNWGQNFDKEVKTFLFYAPLDLTVMVDKGCLLRLMRSRSITKKRNLTGKFTIEETYPDKYQIETDELDDDFDNVDDYDNSTTFKLKDVFGMRNTSLEECLEAVGIENKHKEWAKGLDKGKMRQVALNDPTMFLIYAVKDAEDLVPYLMKHIEMTNNIVKECLGFDPEYTIDNFPGTIGKLDAEVFEMWLNKTISKELMNSLDILAVVNECDEERFKEYQDQVYDKTNSLEEIVVEKNKTTEKPYNIIKTFNVHGDDIISGLGRGSSIYFSSKTDGDARYNALLFGGRCRNERYKEFEGQNIIDPDGSGMYGGCLKDLIYPLGRPTTVHSSNDEVLTIGDVINKKSKFRKNLIPGLWQMIVDVDLSFITDIIYSKLNVDGDKIASKVETDFINSDIYDKSFAVDGFNRDKTMGDFALLTNQIKNGIITHYSLQLLEAVCSKKELAEIKKGRVKTLTYYSKKDRCKNEQEMITFLRNPKQTKSFKKVVQNKVVDERGTKWFGVSLSGFIGKFIEKRTELKTRMDSTEDLDEKEVLNRKQEHIKLFINTLYGCFASPYFQTSNIVLGNNITDKARCSIWMMSKALTTYQTITDGGAFNALQVPNLLTNKRQFKVRRPSVKTFSDVYEMGKNGFIETTSLLDFDELYNNNKVVSDLYSPEDYSYRPEKKELDKIVGHHINQFFKTYGIEFDILIECKKDNISKEAIFINASDYVFIEPRKPKMALVRNSGEGDKFVKIKDVKPTDNVIVRYTIKVRGAKQDDHPKKLLLLYLAGLIDKPDLDYSYTQMLGFNEFYESLNSTNKFDGFLPGDEIDKQFQLSLSLKQRPVKNETEWKNRNRRISHRMRKKSLSRSVAEDPNLRDNLSTYLDEGDYQFFRS